MAAKDGFTPDHPLPVFLYEPAEEPEEPDIGRAWDTAAISSQILKTSFLGVAAAAIVFALLLAGNPLALFANAPAFLADLSALRPGTDQSAPIIPPTAGTQALPPTASEAPTADETAAAFKAAYQNQTEIRQPEAEPLLNRFQAWAAQEDARAQVAAAEPVQDVQWQPVQDAQPQLMQDEPVEEARPQVRHKKKHRQVQREQNAPAEARAEQDPRAKLRRRQNAQAPAPPVQDARSQDRPVQDAQAPSLLQSLGLRN